MNDIVERHLASIKSITDVLPIAGADAIECAMVGGWPVVIRKGEFKPGDLALYIEIDSWVPTELAPFLSKGKEPREFNGVKGERLRTVKLRGQLSQGLLLPVTPAMLDLEVEGLDMTAGLGIQKYEKPLPASLAGVARGNFPSWIRKTDQERVQNLVGKIDWCEEFQVTVKLDGSSMTLWFKDSAWGVCSRNLDLDTTQEGNTFVTMAKKILADDLLTGACNIAIQGELMGPGIQGNRENLIEHEFFVFDIWDIDAQAYWDPAEVVEFCRVSGLWHVPVLHPGASLASLGIYSIADLLASAEGESLFHPVREGLVFKSVDGTFSFKAISNAFLLKEKD